jgi:parallel beta-helix repeat protein
MIRQTLKLAAAAILAILLAVLLVGISYYIIPDQEISPRPSQFHFNVYISAPLSRIIIDANGIVSPINASIMRIGDVYFFTGDVINYTIEIQKDNIVIDGTRHSLVGFAEGSTIFGNQGIYLNGRNNVTIKNVNIEKFREGIVVQNCSSIIIDDNSINNIRSTAITLEACNNITIRGNTVVNADKALDIYPKTFDQILNYSIAENTITNAVAGIQIHSGLFGMITRNSFAEVYTPVWVASNSTRISNNTMTNGIEGIVIGGKYSDNNENSSGGSSCIISGNKIDNFTQSGISFNIGINNMIYENIIANSKYGVTINLGEDINGSWIVENNTIYHNNFLNNVQDVFIGAPSYINYWDNGKEGNYWSSFNGLDSNKDGISDTPCIIYVNNTDRYPLMNPYGNLEIQQGLSSQIFAMYLGISLVISVVIMIGTAFYIRRKRKTIRA